MGSPTNYFVTPSWNWVELRLRWAVTKLCKPNPHAHFKVRALCIANLKGPSASVCSIDRLVMGWQANLILTGCRSYNRTINDISPPTCLSMVTKLNKAADYCKLHIVIRTEDVWYLVEFILFVWIFNIGLVNKNDSYYWSWTERVTDKMTVVVISWHCG